MSVHPLLYANTLKFKKERKKQKPGSELHGEKCKERQPHHKPISDKERINPTGKTRCGQDRKAPICRTGPLQVTDSEDSPGKHTKMGGSAQKSHNRQCTPTGTVFARALAAGDTRVLCGKLRPGPGYSDCH